MNGDGESESEQQQFNALLHSFSIALTDAHLTVLAQSVAELKAAVEKADASEKLREIYQEVARQANQKFAGAADLSPQAASMLANLLDQWKKSKQL